jgi:hypothetical protein
MDLIIFIEMMYIPTTSLIMENPIKNAHKLSMNFPWKTAILPVDFAFYYV